MTDATPPPAPQPIATLTYNGPPPQPSPAVTLPTPDEQFAKHLKDQEAQDAAREAALKEEQTKAKSGGMFGKFASVAKGVAHSASKAANQIHGSVEAKVRADMKEKEKAKWQHAFPEQAASTYHCTYTCNVMHEGQRHEGSLSVSSTHISFRSTHLREAIPLDKVVSIVRSIVLTTKGSGPPYILPVPAEHVIPSCVQVFTADKRLFQFLDFANTATAATSHLTQSIVGNSYERAYNFIDHAWRAATTVPAPGVEYLPQ